MCDVMMTLVSMKTRLKTQGLFDPSEVCAYREVRLCVYCTTELCLSVDKLEKDNKQGTNDVGVQCLCNCILSHVEDWEYLQIEKKEGVRLRKQKKVRLIEKRRRCD